MKLLSILVTSKYPYDKVPESWAKRAYASLHGLSGWYADLILRIKELESWTSDFRQGSRNTQIPSIC